MSVAAIKRGALLGRTGSPASAPIRVDDTTNTIKAVVAGSGTTEVEFLPTNLAAVAVTAATLAVTAALHAGRTIYLNRAAGQVITLPAATGTGNKYKFVMGATATGATSIAVASGTDYMIGTATLYQDGGDTVVGFATANTGTVATESDTMTLFVASNTTGGIKGAIIELEDVASAVWSVRYVSDAGGTEATPFSAAV